MEGAVGNAELSGESAGQWKESWSKRGGTVCVLNFLMILAFLLTTAAFMARSMLYRGTPKRSKYEEFLPTPNEFRFVPFVVEATGRLGYKSSEFIDSQADLGKKEFARPMKKRLRYGDTCSAP